MTKGWTQERRKKQAESIRRHKPWEKSTGPRTQAGKERCKMNALKNGDYSLAAKEVAKALRSNRDFLTHIRAYTAAEKTNGLIKNIIESDGYRRIKKTRESEC